MRLCLLEIKLIISHSTPHLFMTVFEQINVTKNTSIYVSNVYTLMRV